MTPPDTLETTRFRVRRSSPSDAAAVFERWAQDPEVTRFLVWRPHQGLDETQAFLSQCVSSWDDGSEFVWMVEEKSSGLLVGSLAARPGEHGVNLGYLVARDSWGQGVMTEVLEAIVPWWLEQKGVHRVWATCDVENQASARVLEKTGFLREGTLRRWDYHPNFSEEPRDALCYSRIRDEPPE